MELKIIYMDNKTSAIYVIVPYSGDPCHFNSVDPEF